MTPRRATAVEAPAGWHNDRREHRDSRGDGVMAKNDAEDRLDRHGPHGLSHGGAPAQGRLRRLDLEPHPRPRPSRSPPRAARSSTSSPISPASTCCSRSSSTGKDVEEVYFGKNGVHRPQRQAAEDLRRLLDHRGRGIRRRSASKLKQLGADFVAAPVSRQRQGDQGRQALRGRLRRRRPPARPSRR